MWQGALGLRGPTQDGGSYEFQPIFHDGEEPDSPSPGLVTMMRDFPKDPPPHLPIAQLRFREGLRGQLGLWIDTANESIKALLDEEKWLQRRLEAGWTIEAGQKRKEVMRKPDGRLGLKPALGRVWLPSYTASNDTIPLSSTVASFSQPGPELNRALIATGFDLLDEAEIQELPWREWGAGYGNLTAAYASRLGPNGEASELEEAAVEMLRANGQTYFPQVSVRREAAEKSVLDESRAELWLIDPPRPGFGTLLKMLETAAHKPRWVLAYHCHENGLANDSAILLSLGYRLRSASAVDAFPATPHLEVISLWQLP